MPETNNLDRRALLEKLQNYQFVPGHGPNYSKMTDDELRKTLSLFKNLFKKSYYEK